MENCLAEIFNLTEFVSGADLDAAMRETQEAIRRVSAGARMVELRPQNSYIRRLQHEMAREANLISQSRGEEPNRRVRIYRK